MHLVPPFCCPRHVLSIAIVATAVAACSAFDKKDIAEYQVDAGSVKLSVISVAPWEEVVSHLSPNFGLTADGAVARTLQTNALAKQQSLRTLAGSFGISSLGPTPETTTQTTNAADGSVTTTVTEKAQPSPADALVLDNLPGLPGSLPPLTLDNTLVSEPIINYKAATALYQEVQLLNRYLNHAVISEGYRPYLVRFQISVLPNLRNQPFDVFSDLHFLPGSEILDKELGSEYELLKITPFDGTREQRLTQDITNRMNQLFSKFEDGGHWESYSEDEQRRAFEDELRNIVKNLARNEQDLEGREDASYENSVKSYLEGILLKGDVKREFDNIESVIDDLGGRARAEKRLENIGNLLRRSDVADPTLGDFAASIPKVIPLLVTDSLETSAEGQVAQIARQLSLLGAGTTGGTPFRGQVQSLLNELQEAQARDLNSLLSISQLNDNSVRLRLGARYDVTNDYEMTARTHNITLLINVPEPVASLDHPRDRRLRVLAINKMRDARTGDLLENGLQFSREFRSEIDAQTNAYKFTDYDDRNGDGTHGDFCMGQTDKDDAERKRIAISANGIIRKLVTRHVIYGDYERFAEATSCMWGKAPKDPMSQRDQRMLWAALSGLTTAIPADRVDIDLPKSVNPSADPLQTIFISGRETEAVTDSGNECHGKRFANGVMTDDKKKTIVRVPLKRTVEPSSIQLSLQVPHRSKLGRKAKKSHEFSAEKVEFEGSVLKATFPSLSAFREKHGGGADIAATLIADVSSEPWRDESFTSKVCRTAHIDIYLLDEKKPENPTFDVTASLASGVKKVTVTGGQADLNLLLSWKSGGTRDIGIVVDNGDIKNEPSTWKLNSKRQLIKRGVESGAESFKIELENVISALDITLSIGPLNAAKDELDTSKVKPSKLEIRTLDTPAQ
ncbi:MAG: hypothetical protein AAGA21_24510 [Pseudomonadota bacterium]